MTFVVTIVRLLAAVFILSSDKINLVTGTGQKLVKWFTLPAGNSHTESERIPDRHYSNRTGRPTSVLARKNHQKTEQIKKTTHHFAVEFRKADKLFCLF